MGRPADPSIAIDELDVCLRSALPSDEAFVRKLFDSARRELFGAVGMPEPMLARMLEQQFYMQTESYTQQFPLAASLIVERRDAPVGRLLLDCTLRRWHVIDLAITAGCCGLGIGTVVMRSVASAARTQGVPALTLMVRQTNIGAIRFYERLGFVDSGTASDAGYLAMAKRLDF